MPPHDDDDDDDDGHTTTTTTTRSDTYHAVVVVNARTMTDNNDDDDDIGSCRLCLERVTRADVARHAASKLGCACTQACAHTACGEAYVRAKTRTARNVNLARVCEICSREMVALPTPRDLARRDERRRRFGDRADDATMDSTRDDDDNNGVPASHTVVIDDNDNHHHRQRRLVADDSSRDAARVRYDPLVDERVILLRAFALCLAITAVRQVITITIAKLIDIKIIKPIGNKIIKIVADAARRRATRRTTPAFWRCLRRCNDGFFARRRRRLFLA